MTTRFPLALAIALALATTACQPAPVPDASVPANVAAGSAPAAAVATLAGRALVGSTPLANAEVVVYDPIAHHEPAAPGAGGDTLLEWARTTVKTDADGRFNLALALKPGQAAEVYVSDGHLSVCGILAGPGVAIRHAGKVPLGPDGLLLDQEATTTASVMLASLKALGKAAASAKGKRADEVLALQAKAIDAMASTVGPTAAKLVALAGSADIAKTIAEHMVQADPRLPDDAAKRRVLADDGGNRALSSLVSALRAAGVAELGQIQQVIADGYQELQAAVGQALSGEPGAGSFVAEVQQGLQAAAQDDHAAAETLLAPDVADDADEPGPPAPQAPAPAGGSAGGGEGGATQEVPPFQAGPAVTADTAITIATAGVQDPPATAPRITTGCDSRTFVVAAATAGQWVDTGVALAAGQEYAVSAQASSGGATTTLFDHFTNAAVGADGLAGQALASCWVANDGTLGAYGALIGKVGAGGTPFLVGSRLPFTAAAAEGHLFLAINNHGSDAASTGTVMGWVSLCPLHFSGGG